MATDQDLVAAALAGDSASFGQLVKRHEARVHRVASRHTADGEAARDVTQETFLRAFLRLSDLRDADALAGWLASIVVSTSLSWYRQHQAYLRMREHVAEPEPAAPDAERPDRLLEAEETRRTVREALAGLPSSSRDTLALYYLDGLSTAETASRLGLSEPAVRQRLSRARRQLEQEVMRMAGENLEGRPDTALLAEEVVALIDRVRELLQQEEYGLAIEALGKVGTAQLDGATADLMLAAVYQQYAQTTGNDGYRERAMAILEELVEREPDNLLARLRLAEMHSYDGKLEDLVAEHEAILAGARGGALEPFALLRIARVYGPRRRREEATRYYREVIEKEPRLAGFAYQEMAVGAFVDGDLQAARKHLEESMASYQAGNLEALSREAFGESLWRFGGTRDSRQVFLFQTQVWLAGICAKAGDAEAARKHLREAADRLQLPEMAAEKANLAESMTGIVERNFPELAQEPLMKLLAA